MSRTPTAAVALSLLFACSSKGPAGAEGSGNWWEDSGVAGTGGSGDDGWGVAQEFMARVAGAKTLRAKAEAVVALT